MAMSPFAPDYDPLRHFLVEDSWPTLPSHSNIYDALAPNVETLFQLRPVLGLLRKAFCLRLAQYRDICSTLLPDIERDAWIAQFYSDCAAAFHLWDIAPIPIGSFFAQGIVEYIRPIPMTRALAGFDELEKIFNLPSYLMSRLHHLIFQRALA
ncbi:hypothetical protein B0H14DRAFT_2652791 [Mycena olivaceomarginata]|nr:hypothetical protein B0H14DRAFT_2652791 [Mycena olivaceomarginata]